MECAPNPPPRSGPSVGSDAGLPSTFRESRDLYPLLIRALLKKCAARIHSINEAGKDPDIRASDHGHLIARPRRGFREREGWERGKWFAQSGMFHREREWWEWGKTE
jgi:hypothetical protein